MTPIVETEALVASPLADLHALAGELSIEGFRLLAKADLVAAILIAQGVDADEARRAAEQVRPPVVPRAAAASPAAGRANQTREPVGERRERGGAGRGRERARSGSERTPRARRERESTRERGGDREAARERGGERTERERRPARRAASDTAEVASTPSAPVSGVLEILPNRNGFIRPRMFSQSPEDVIVSQGEIKRLKLRRGDAIAAQARPPRRSESSRTLTAIETVNGRSLEDHQAGPGTVDFDRSSAKPAARRIGHPLFGGPATFGRGSRVLVIGRTKSIAASVLRDLAGHLGRRERDLTTMLVVVAARPEEAEMLEALPAEVGAVAFDRPIDDAVKLAEFGLEHGKRVAESGGDAVLIVDGLDLLPEDVAKQLFVAARRIEGAGSLTVVASAAAGSIFESVATTTAVMSAGRRGKIRLDKGASSTVDAGQLR